MNEWREVWSVERVKKNRNKKKLREEKKNKPVMFRGGESLLNGLR